MKKWMPAVLSMVMLVYTFTFSALAIPATTTSTTSSSSSSSSSSGTSSTASYGDLNASFSYNYYGDKIQVTWNTANAAGVTIDRVTIGTSPFYVNNTTGSFDVDISGIHPGVHSLTYVLSDGEKVVSSTPVERAGDLSTVMTLSVENGQIVAKVTDNYGNPVPGLTVSLYMILDTPLDHATTDSNGKAVFTIPLPDDLKSVKCLTEAYDRPLTVGSIHYSGTSAIFASETPSSTDSTGSSSTSGTTSTTRRRTTTTTAKPTSAGTTASTYRMITGAGTTSLADGKLGVNVNFDVQVAKDFDYSHTDFAARARLFMAPEVYSGIVGDSTATLMLQVATSDKEVTDQHISSAITGKSKFSLFHAEDTLRIPLDLSLMFVDFTHDASTEITAPDAEMTIELPVPKSMRSDTYTVVAAVITKDGIAQFLNTTVESGTVQFTASQLSSIVLLGFEKPAGLSANAGGVPLIVIAMILLGVLMLVGAGLLLYFFFLRRPKDKSTNDTQPADELPHLDATQAVNIRPYGIAEEPTDSQPAAPPSGGISLGSLGNRQNTPPARPAKKNPKDYDLDI